MRIRLPLALAAALGAACATTAGDPPADPPSPDPAAMRLGAFSVSLAVDDLAASRAFYEALGFEAEGGDPAQNWLILRNPDGHVIGLFQGMFERNILTFNPGWNQGAEALDGFLDVREIQARLEARGLALATRADPESTGPASLTLLDPDGNPVLVDQHVPAP